MKFISRYIKISLDIQNSIVGYISDRQQDDFIGLVLLFKNKAKEY
jgi:hypothetical protein